MSIVFSIVVPVYNNAADLMRCIESLRSLDYARERYEIIVVDNKSTDETASVAASMNVSVLRETQFQSSYAARNTGIKAAKGKFIAFTDSDCIVDRGWLKAIEAAASDQSAGCLAGEILSVPPTTTVERFSENIGLLRQKGPLSGWHFKPYAQTANAVYRRAVFEQIGLFDPTTNSGGDAAIAWRMLDNTKFTIRFVPEAIVYHHHRTSVPDIYSQFRRYGGGKMSWALSQKDYTPPAIAALEKDVVGLFAKHLDALEAADVGDEVLFSGLRATTQAAHLSGYLQDLLRYAIDGESIVNAPAVARKRAPTCNICGSRSFLPGPRGRFANGRPPMCSRCGSLERHRVLHGLLSKVNAMAKSQLRCLILGEKLRNQGDLLQSLDLSDVPATDLGQADKKYDLAVAVELFKDHTEEGIESVIDGLVSYLSERGGLLTIQTGSSEKLNSIRKTIEDLLPGVRTIGSFLHDDVTNSNLIGTFSSPPEGEVSPLLYAGIFSSAK